MTSFHYFLLLGNKIVYRILTPLNLATDAVSDVTRMSSAPVSPVASLLHQKRVRNVCVVSELWEELNVFAKGAVRKQEVVTTFLFWREEQFYGVVQKIQLTRQIP